jgi:iron-sulfur cluster assembly protein
MVFLTESAAKQIRRLREDDNIPADKFLRVKVAKGGCSGLSYKLDFDTTIGSSDKTFEDHGEKVIIDTQSYLYVLGMTLDFSGGLNGRGFVFTNPNAAKTCGCGSSFAV